MLRGGNEKINEISAALGFETASYFTRFFKKYTGETPQQYRNHAAEAAPRPIHAK
jgi:two-component system response regulator YesN